MIWIAHRGNVDGRNPARENAPGYVREALASGFHAEVDVWWHEGGFALGHDAPQYPVDAAFLEDARLWCHAKNLSALRGMLELGGIHCFWHQEDDATLTSRGYVWTYPGTEAVEGAVCVMPESQRPAPQLTGWGGVCSDVVGQLRGSCDVAVSAS